MKIKITALCLLICSAAFAQATGATILSLTQFPGGVKGTERGYIEMLDLLRNYKESHPSEKLYPSLDSLHMFKKAHGMIAQKVAETLSDADFKTMESVKSAIWPLAEDLGRGEVLWPLRVALSGKKQSPDPFTLAFVLGREETLARIQTACDKIGE